jgi:hypothetical protein
MKAFQIAEVFPSKSRPWFEYHCQESHDSGDAELWYRSHQRVTVLACDNAAEVNAMVDERYAGCHLLAYRVRFDDGFEGTAMEDELYGDVSGFYRPDPPARAC